MTNQNPNLTDVVLETKKENAAPETLVKKGNLTTRIEKEKRTVAILGVGDGGSNVASLSLVKTGGLSFIYNTSATCVKNQKHTKAIILDNTDGAGQDMNYSKEKYDTQGAAVVYELLNQYKHEIDFLFPVVAIGGGTGAGAIELMASDIIENFEKDVNPETGEPYFKTIVVLMAPSHLEAGKNFLNALQVQKRLVERDIPHIIFDNNHYATKGIVASSEIYERINNDVVKFVELFKGELFKGEKIERSIDNKDFFKIAMHGKRLNFFHSTEPISARETLDEYILRVITNTAQPEPVKPTCYALFVKGPAEVLKRLNDAIPQVKAKYSTTVPENYAHLEISETFEVALVTSGSKIHEGSIAQLSAIYRDSLRAKEEKSDLGVFGSLDEDPYALEMAKPANAAKEGFKRANR